MLSMEEIRGAVARGWCHEPNTHKEMDPDLAEAISEEIWKMLLAAPLPKDRERVD